MWPVHAVFMGFAVVSLLVAIWAVTLGKRHRGSFHIHKIAATAAFALLAAGLIVAAGIVQASGGPHLRVPHGVFGAVTIALGFLTGTGGIVTTKMRSLRKRLRPFHVWTGWAAFVMVMLTILAGLRQVGIL